MKKQFMLLIVLVVSMTTVRAQSSSTTIHYNTAMQPALVLELPNTMNDAKKSIIGKLKQTGYNPQTEGHLFWKDNKTDGFYIFKNVILSSISSQKLDMYFKVVPKNHEEKDNSLVYLLVSTGNESFASPLDDTTLWNSAVIFLNSFMGKTTIYNLEQSTANQESMVDIAQNKLSSLQKDEKDLANQIKKYQDGIVKIQSSRKDQQVNVDNQVKLLDELKLKRRG